MANEDQLVPTNFLKFVKHTKDGLYWPCLVFESSDELQRVLQQRKVPGLKPERMTLRSLVAFQRGELQRFDRPLGIILGKRELIQVQEKDCVSFFENMFRSKNKRATSEATKTELDRAMCHATGIVKMVVDEDKLHPGESDDIFESGSSFFSESDAIEGGGTEDRTQKKRKNLSAPVAQKPTLKRLARTATTTTELATGRRQSHATTSKHSRSSSVSEPFFDDTSVGVAEQSPISHRPNKSHVASTKVRFKERAGHPVKNSDSKVSASTNKKSTKKVKKAEQVAEQVVAWRSTDHGQWFPHYVHDFDNDRAWFVPSFEDVRPTLEELNYKFEGTKIYRPHVNPDTAREGIEFFSNHSAFRTFLCKYGVEGELSLLDDHDAFNLKKWVRYSIIPTPKFQSNESFTISPIYRCRPTNQLHKVFVKLGFQYLQSVYYVMPNTRPNLVGGILLNRFRFDSNEGDDTNLLLWICRNGFPEACNWEGFDESEKISLGLTVAHFKEKPPLCLFGFDVELFSKDVPKLEKKQPEQAAGCFSVAQTSPTDATANTDRTTTKHLDDDGDGSVSTGVACTVVTASPLSIHPSREVCNSKEREHSVQAQEQNTAETEGGEVSEETNATVMNELPLTQDFQEDAEPTEHDETEPTVLETSSESDKEPPEDQNLDGAPSAATVMSTEKDGSQSETKETGHEEAVDSDLKSTIEESGKSTVYKKNELPRETENGEGEAQEEQDMKALENVAELEEPQTITNGGNLSEETRGENKDNTKEEDLPTLKDNHWSESSLISCTQRLQEEERHHPTQERSRPARIVPRQPSPSGDSQPSPGQILRDAEDRRVTPPRGKTALRVSVLEQPLSPPEPQREPLWPLQGMHQYTGVWNIHGP